LKNSLKAKLKEGKTVYGIGMSVANPEVAEIIGKMEFDWAFIDTEHSPMEVKDVQLLMQAMSASATVPIVRVPWNDMVMIKRALDIGAYGIIIPWVNTREDAVRAVQAIRYPPKGLRGFGPRRASLFDPDYVKTANDELLLCV
jgi:2-keto-3-deoxy-L-rhamnonate aldolase RhmA